MTKFSTLLGVIAILLPLKGLNSYTEYADISSYQICHAPDKGGCLGDPIVTEQSVNVPASPKSEISNSSNTQIAAKKSSKKYRKNKSRTRNRNNMSRSTHVDFNASYTPDVSSNEEELSYRATSSRKTIKSAGASLDDALRYSMKIVPGADPYTPYTGYYPNISSGSYKTVLTDVKHHRQVLSEKYDNSRTLAEKEAVLKDAGNLFAEAFLNHIMPFWYGTPWDFYGHTEDPGTGFIACGYLVSTTLTHLGVNVNRFALAQQWPVDIVRSLCAEEYYQYSSKSSVIAAIRDKGYGLYVIGLDNHVGFIKYDQWGVNFIHSNWAGSRTVVSEDPQYSTAFSSTRNYYLGKLSNNEQFITKWLHATNIKVTKS